ncbi:MAG TPA: homogentisate 1,2-dioxygenase [Acidobacteria bacterium]|nr:homogentisate 1,2-dioxygenase [Acidobacteriota bacterium]
MIHRLQRGLVPPKPHIAFEVDGALAYEHCFTRQGFDGSYSILYHRRPPHWVAEAEDLGPHPGAGAPAPRGALERRHYLSGKIPRGGSPFVCRRRILANPEIAIWIAHADQDDPTLVVNGDGDELIFVHRGSGRVDSPYGELIFDEQDYVYVPRGVPHRWRLDGSAELLIMEGLSYIDLPAQFRNAAGQIKMDAPYSHRDFRPPHWPEGGPTTLSAPRRMVTKRLDRLSSLEMSHDPFDVIGWDGVVWPFAFPIRAYQPRTGLVHLPPTIHITFAGAGFVICSFVPRVVDFHDEAIPCPYPHSSVDCDEVLFYVEGNFTSRKGIGAGSISYHPMGLPHGPHPGTYEASIGTSRTSEMAVMIDTFSPLAPTSHAQQIEDRGYNTSWVR